MSPGNSWREPSWPIPPSAKALVEGGPAAVEKSSDPMIVLARELEPMMQGEN